MDGQYPPKPSVQLGVTPFMQSTRGRIIIIGIIFLLLLALLTLNYLNILPLSLRFPNQLGWLPHQAISQPTTQSQPILSPAPLTLPVPLDHPSVNNVVITYFFDGRIQSIKSSKDQQILTLVSGNGVIFPREITIRNNFPIYTNDNKGQFVTNKAATDLKKNDELTIDIGFDTSKNEFFVVLIRLKPRVNLTP